MRQPCRQHVIGASPSGKARGFDPRMRRFESCRPSHTGKCAAVHRGRMRTSRFDSSAAARENGAAQRAGPEGARSAATSNPAAPAIRENALRYIAAGWEPQGSTRARQRERTLRSSAPAPKGRGAQRRVILPPQPYGNMRCGTSRQEVNLKVRLERGSASDKHHLSHTERV